jgi:hypothetical protein
MNGKRPRSIPITTEFFAARDSNPGGIVKRSDPPEPAEGLAMVFYGPDQTIANRSIGYIPNRSAYPEGNYEVVSARCAEGSGDLLVQVALKMLEELKAQTPSRK